MSQKIGRNDPCPCGSGKKFKQCCYKVTQASASARVSQPHDGAGERASQWLVKRHGRAFLQALEEETQGVYLRLFDDDDDAALEAMAITPQAVLNQLRNNLIGLLIAQGEIEINGEYRRINNLLTGPTGPLMTVGQRAWIKQLGERALRLYDVTEVDVGVGVTICDAMDDKLAPIFVHERMGSQSMHVGMKIGARVMQVGDGYQFSGEIFPLSLIGGRAVQETLHAIQKMDGVSEEDAARAYENIIVEGWLAQHILPLKIPKMIYAGTGEAMLFTTDHYEVQSWPELEAALAAQPDVHGDREGGWDQLVRGDDEQLRPLVSITPKEGDPRRLGVFYKTAGTAEKGRAWFEQTAGSAVKFLLSEVSDPVALLSKNNGPATRRERPSTALPEGVDPETAASIIEELIHRMYANWADEPLPALNDLSPRQALATESGRERVKGLLRMYQDGEVEKAAEQGRREISYQFLWDELDLVD